MAGVPASFVREIVLCICFYGFITQTAAPAGLEEITADDVKTTCDAPSVKAGETTNLTCDFKKPADNRNIVVEFYNRNGKKSSILECYTTKDQPPFDHKCEENSFFRKSGHFNGRYFTLTFTANENMEGDYACMRLPVDPNKYSKCSFKLDTNKEQTTRIPPTEVPRAGDIYKESSNTKTIVGLTVGLPLGVLLFVGVISVYCVYRKRRLDKQTSLLQLFKESLPEQCCRCCSTPSPNHAVSPKNVHTEVNSDIPNSAAVKEPLLDQPQPIPSNKEGQKHTDQLDNANFAAEPLLDSERTLINNEENLTCKSESSHTNATLKPPLVSNQHPPRKEGGPGCEDQTRIKALRPHDSPNLPARDQTSGVPASGLRSSDIYPSNLPSPTKTIDAIEKYEDLPYRIEDSPKYLNAMLIKTQDSNAELTRDEKYVFSCINAAITVIAGAQNSKETDPRTVICPVPPDPKEWPPVHKLAELKMWIKTTVRDYVGSAYYPDNVDEVDKQLKELKDVLRCIDIYREDLKKLDDQKQEASFPNDTNLKEKVIKKLIVVEELGKLRKRTLKKRIDAIKDCKIKEETTVQQQRRHLTQRLESVTIEKEIESSTPNETDKNGEDKDNTGRIHADE